MEVLLITIGLFLFGLIGLSVVSLFYILMGFVDHIRFGVQFIKTPTWVLDWLSHNLNIKDGTTLYDLGCGDGLVLRYLKRAFPNVRMTGIEGAFFPLLRAKWLTRKSDIKILHSDFNTVSISDADIIFCFLTQHLMTNLEKHLKENLKKGARVYSYAFTFPTWKPTREIPNPNDPEKSSLFIYTKE